MAGTSVFKEEEIKSKFSIAVWAKTFKYGSTKDYVLDLEVVTAKGEILRTGSNTIKNATGYNLYSTHTSWAVHRYNWDLGRMGLNPALS